MTELTTAEQRPQNQNDTTKTWYLYLIENKLGQIYTGITTDPKRRIAQHRGELKGGAKSLKGKSPLGFRAIFEVDCKSNAAKLEYAVKRMSRPQKDRIISEGQLDAMTCVKAQFAD
ncbi:GIY-YIG nuclease family protein [Alteromonas gracilis]|uniref:GIY-YIG nuclease family protein n=1 Tax=Alteromonas gracilis TaxID=1479524 RepID=UPI003734D3DB